MVAQPLIGGRSTKTIEAPMTHPGHAYFLLFCEEGLPSGMFLSGGKLTTFLDSLISKVLRQGKLRISYYLFNTECFTLYELMEIKSIKSNDP